MKDDKDNFSKLAIDKKKYSLIICEKPGVANRISHVLASKTVNQIRINNSRIYEISYNSSNYVVISSKGHLYTLNDFYKDRKLFPVFDLSWVPIRGNQKNQQNKKLIDLIKRLSENADKIIHACDYDPEGELIGYNILQFACKNKYHHCLRAKFSTLTDEEIIDSFNNLEKPNTGMAYAGMFRHMLDFIYGINFSRSLMSSINFKEIKTNLTVGRVQSPTLKFVIDRDYEINCHVPLPYWSIKIQFEKDNQSLLLSYIKPRISSIDEAEIVLKNCQNIDGLVSEISQTNEHLQAPYPFNLGDLQKESFRLFRFSPSYTLFIAEKLYLQALISYPRTNSQTLPTSINNKRILKDLAKISDEYEIIVYKLLSQKKLYPNNGNKSDPAHPAIHPTGRKPSRLTSQEFKVYDLIVKRYFSTFGESTIHSKTTIYVTVNKEHVFYITDYVVSKKGWIDFYVPYNNMSKHSNHLPKLKVGDKLKNIKIIREEKFSEPPKRFNYSSLLSKMEKEEIGTKSTRANIIDSLIKRNYIEVKKNILFPTKLGMILIDYLQKKSPRILSTNLTRMLEKYLREIELGVRDYSNILDDVINDILLSIHNYKKNDLEIDSSTINMLKNQTENYYKKRNNIVVGPCPLCRKGNLQIIRSRKTRKRFISCSNYFNEGCSITLPLPQKGIIKSTTKSCSSCNWSVIHIFYYTLRLTKSLCININCPNKKKQVSNQIG